MAAVCGLVFLAFGGLSVFQSSPMSSLVADGLLLRLLSSPLQPVSDRMLQLQVRFAPSQVLLFFLLASVLSELMLLREPTELPLFCSLKPEALTRFQRPPLSSQPGGVIGDVVLEMSYLYSKADD